MNKEPTYHPEELENAEKEARPILVSRLLRYDHLTHSIPLGSLVEVDLEIYKTFEDSKVHLKGRCTLVVVLHHRDCDGTPLYGLSDIPVCFPKHPTTFSQPWMQMKALSSVWEWGCPEESLKVVGKVPKMYNSVSELFGS